VASGASGIRRTDVNSMIGEALVAEDAPFHVMALVAQGVIGERVGHASRRSSGGRRRWFQGACPFEQVWQVRAVRTRGAAGDSQIASSVVVVAIATVDITGARKLAVSQPRSARADWLLAQAGHITAEAHGEIPRTRHGMIGRAELELQARVEAVGIVHFEHSLWITPVADAHHAEIGRLGLIRAVGMTLEADFILVAALEEIRIGGGLPFYTQQRPAYQGRLGRRCTIGEMRIMAIYAFRVPRGGARGFRKRVQSRSRTLRSIVD